MNKNNLNFAFWGTPEVASETLQILKQKGFLPSVIITSPDSKQGRGMKTESTPVSKFAEENNIPCLKPENLDSDFAEKINKNKYDIFVVIAYGKIIPENILNLPKFGSINIHYSLLPKYRGASPIESAILNGEIETGITIQKMVYKMDAGDIVAQEKTNIEKEETASVLRKRLIKMGGELLVKILPDILENKTKTVPQDEKKTSYCKKIKKEDGLVDIEKENGVFLYNKFRAYARWPRTFFFKNSKRIIITEATLENEKFIIKKVLPEGKKEIKYEDFLKTSTSK